MNLKRIARLGLRPLLVELTAPMRPSGAKVLFPILGYEHQLGIVDAFGAPVRVLDANGQPLALDPDAGATGDLTRYIGLLDAAHQIGHELG